MNTSKSRPPVEIGFFTCDDTEQLGRRPKRRAAQRLDLGFVGVTLQEIAEDRTQQVDTDGRDGHSHQDVAQPSMGLARSAEDIANLPPRCAENFGQHASILAGAPGGRLPQ